MEVRLLGQCSILGLGKGWVLSLFGETVLPAVVLLDGFLAEVVDDSGCRENSIFQEVALDFLGIRLEFGRWRRLRKTW